MNITIIIPTYNRAGTIAGTINSILRQIYKDFECIVVDDFSQDNTKLVIQEYQQKDERIKYIMNERKKGAQGARNTGLLNAKGNWIVFFDSDDSMHPLFLNKLHQRVVAYNADISTCFTKIIDFKSNQEIDSSQNICEGSIRDNLFSGKCYINFISGLIRKKNLIEIGLLDENCPSHQEFETHLRLSKKSIYTTVPEYLVTYYVGAPDTISTNKTKHVAGLLYILFKHQWIWRQKYYKSFLERAKKNWSIIKINQDSFLFVIFTVKLFLIVPELCLILAKLKIKKYFNTNKRA